MSSGFKFLPSLTSAFSHGTDLLTYYIICLFIFLCTHTHTALEYKFYEDRDCLVVCSGMCLPGLGM